MKQVWSLLGATTAAFILISCSQKKSSDASSGWTPLFNGTDLTGWTVKIKGYDAGDNFGNTFRVEEGMIKVRYEQYDSFATFRHLFQR